MSGIDVEARTAVALQLEAISSKGSSSDGKVAKAARVTTHWDFVLKEMVVNSLCPSYFAVFTSIAIIYRLGLEMISKQKELATSAMLRKLARP